MKFTNLHEEMRGWLFKLADASYFLKYLDFFNVLEWTHETCIFDSLDTLIFRVYGS